MIYAVNKRTKAHRTLGSVAMAENEWELVQADPDGWIEWHASPGAESPVANRNGCGLAVMRLANGEEVDAVGFWDDTPLPKYRVVAYRPILDTKVSHPGTMSGPDKYRAAGGECPAWDGEGLPTVGEVCNIEEFVNGQWVICDFDYRIDYIGHRVVVATTVATPREVERVFDRQVKFRPIRSEEDRITEELERIMYKPAMTREMAARIYEAIRDGKVPGVKLAGGEG